jgi:hypothetical protein
MRSTEIILHTGTGCRWKALVSADEKGIRSAASTMNAGDAEELFAGILTQRPFDEVHCLLDELLDEMHCLLDELLDEMRGLLDELLDEVHSLLDELLNEMHCLLDECLVRCIVCDRESHTPLYQ